MRRWIVFGVGAAGVAVVGLGVALQGCAGVDCSHDPTCSAIDVGSDGGDAGLRPDGTSGEGSGSEDGGTSASDAGPGADTSAEATTDTGAPDGPTPGDAGCPAPTTLLCSGICVDPTQLATCGSCTNACAAPPSGHGQVACGDAGSCQVSCAAGYHACSGDCLPDTDTPASDACVVSEAFGVFASPGGSDGTGTGTQLSPYATLGKAMDVAKGSGKRVYACGSAGNYGENLVVGTARDGVSVYGGLDCTSPGAWSYGASKVATVAPSSGIALSVSGLVTGVTFTDMGFQAPDAPATAPASGAGASSIAVVVSDSAGVVFTRGTIKGGHGQPGAAGTLAPYSNFPTASDLHGNSGTDSAGGLAKPASCPGVASATATSGGKGGDPPSGSGDPGQPDLSDAGTGGPGGGTCSNGNDGFSGIAGSDGAGASTLGTLSGTTWLSSGGTSGSAGGPGQGGSGGGAQAGGGGGGGGAGGCGGAGAGHGSGGGGSVALLAVNSTALSLNGVQLIAGTAGAGGPGGAGQPGQSPGGVRGVATGAGGCNGGNGGAGGNGGGGGGGAGGPSVGVLYSGTAPTLDSATMSSFQAGIPGAGGEGGAVAADGGLSGSNNGVGGRALSGMLVPAP